MSEEGSLAHLHLRQNIGLEVMDPERYHLSSKDELRSSSPHYWWNQAVTKRYSNPAFPQGIQSQPDLFNSAITQYALQQYVPPTEELRSSHPSVQGASLHPIHLADGEQWKFTSGLIPLRVPPWTTYVDHNTQHHNSYLLNEINVREDTITKQKDEILKLEQQLYHYRQVLSNLKASVKTTQKQPTPATVTTPLPNFTNFRHSVSSPTFSISSTMPKKRYWSEDEHKRFLEALEIYGIKNKKMIAEYVGTRDQTQVRHHAEKYFLRLRKEKKGINGKPSVNEKKKTQNNYQKMSQF